MKAIREIIMLVLCAGVLFGWGVLIFVVEWVKEGFRSR
jgi:hypothetical protein